jgi:Metallo-peptidase family M12B Reprolysin-like
MMKKLFLLLILGVFANCVQSAETDDISDASPVADTWPSDQEIMWRYNAEVLDFQMKNGMSKEWAWWMKERIWWWSKSFVKGRHDHQAHVYVRYEKPVQYVPAWSSEEEHFLALESLAESSFPGWDFTFSSYEEGVKLEGNDVVAVLGHAGVSYAAGRTIYLVYETIFAHEFGHTLGLPHHYCGDAVGVMCENFPPGEGKCTMARDTVSFGPTERFVLQMQSADEERINAALDNIHSRYPR